MELLELKLTSKDRGGGDGENDVDNLDGDHDGDHDDVIPTT